MHRYRCQLCGITSDPYLLRAGAERHGVTHRRIRHGGDRPDGERILTNAYRSPQGREWAPVVAVLVILAVALLAKAF